MSHLPKQHQSNDNSTSANCPELPNPFKLDLGASCKNPLLKLGSKAIEKPLEKLLSLTPLQSVYTNSTLGPGDDFVSNLLSNMRVTYTYFEGMLDAIPKEGPVVVTANHPFGGVEGVILIDLLRKVRPDVKIFANFLLSRIPDLRSYFIFVDPFDSKQALKKNMRPMREALQWLKQGGCIGVFPSGTVSHFHWKRKEISDPDWSLSIARIIRKSRASVLPLYFHGANGLFFQISGLIHPLLRTIQIPRELVNKSGKHFDINTGSLITAEKVDEFPSDEDLLLYLRLRTYILANRNPNETVSDSEPASNQESEKKILAPLAPHVEASLIKAEISALPSRQRLLDQGDLTVYFAEAEQIPNILQEIGRLREETFRKVKEGTGRPLDLDYFDSFYIHLFLWNRAAGEIVGAYRLVDAEQTCIERGIKHLYTHTLFAYKPRLLKQIGPALELGRSFVREEYQRNFNSLNMLWKGIARYVVLNPRYHGLFGTVSISSEYDSISRHLIATFLQENSFLPQLAKLIRARNPMKTAYFPGVDRKAAGIVVKDLDDISELLMELKSKHKAIPILLKQYLKLGGKLLGFNIDKDFGNVLDGLIYIDLRETEPRILQRYMGKLEAEEFFRFHGEKEHLEKTNAYLPTRVNRTG